MGVNEFIMGQGHVDHAQFGVFSGDWSPPVQETIDMSKVNDSVFRGTFQIVGPQLNGVATDLPLWRPFSPLKTSPRPIQG